MTYGIPNERWPWALDEEGSRPFFKQALDAGITFFDTANVYSQGVSEEVVGRAIRELTRRDHVVIGTKVHGAMGTGPNESGLSRGHIMSQIDASLRRLGMDYVDLYQIHRFDETVPVEETMEALHDVVKAGKARYLGASSMYSWQFAKLQHAAERNGWTRFVSMQPHYNLVYREEEREMLPLCADTGVGVIPWSPLARGFLAGNRTQEGGETDRAKTDDFARALYFQEDDFAVVERLSAVAEARGLPNARVALAWLLANPVVTAPIVGATKAHHLADAVAAIDVELTPAELSSLEEPYRAHPVLGMHPPRPARPAP
jgi:aryl-alcohol dehydrogenase (NADP+)